MNAHGLTNSGICGTATSVMADQTSELLDVVNENNQVIGIERRSVVHARGLRHRAVYCVVTDDTGQILLQQRSPKYDDILLPILDSFVNYAYA